MATCDRYDESFKEATKLEATYKSTGDIKFDRAEDESAMSRSTLESGLRIQE